MAISDITHLSGISLKNNKREPHYLTLTLKMIMNAGKVAKYSTQDRTPMEAKASAMSDNEPSNKRRNNTGT